jgi:hypothetical protein
MCGKSQMNVGVLKKDVVICVKYIYRLCNIDGMHQTKPHKSHHSPVVTSQST